MKLTDILYKKALTKCDGNIVGEIVDVCINKNMGQLAYFVIENMQKNIKYVVDYTYLLCIKDVAVFDSFLPFEEMDSIDKDSLICDIYQKQVFSCAGDYKGVVEDIDFTSNKKVARFVTNICTFSMQSILAVGDCIVTKATIQQKRKIPSPVKNYPVKMLATATSLVDDNKSGEPIEGIAHDKSIQNAVVLQGIDKENIGVENTDINHLPRDVSAISQNDSPLAVSLLPNSKLDDALYGNTIEDVASLLSAKAPISISPKEPLISQNAFEKMGINALTIDDEHTPNRVICNCDFLIGRTLSCDLCTYNNTPIAMKGEKIDHHILSLARKYGKLVELTLISTD